MPSRAWLHRIGALAITAALAACVGPEPTVAGEIRDDRIVLGQETAPQSVWLELTNVGTQPCELVVIRTELPPDELPTRDGRVLHDFSGTGASPMEAYVEINGEPVIAGGEGLSVNGAHAVVAPSEIARIQLALTGVPEREERVIVCNAPGDYEAGRYAILRFDR